LVEEQPQVTEPECPVIPGAVATKECPKSKKMKCHMSTSKKSLQSIEPTEASEPEPLEIPGATSVRDGPKGKPVKKQLHGESKHKKKPLPQTQSSSGPQDGAQRHGNSENQDAWSLSSTSDDEIVADVSENPVTATVVDENDLERQILSKYLKPPPVLVPGVRMNSKSYDDKDEDSLKNKQRRRVVLLILGIVVILVIVGIVVGSVLFATQSNESELPSLVNGTTAPNQISSQPGDPLPTSSPTGAPPAPITPSPTAQPTLSLTAPPVVDTTVQPTPYTTPGPTSKPNPVNFVCSRAESIPDPNGGSVLMTGSTIYAEEPAYCGEQNANVVWYSVFGTGNPFEISTCSEKTDFPTQITKTSDCELSSLYCTFSLIDEECTVNTNGASLFFHTEPNQNYGISVGGRSSGDMGSFELKVTEYILPENAFCDDPKFIQANQGGSVSVSGSTVNAYGDKPTCGADGSDSVWYAVTGNGKTFTVSTCSEKTDFPTQITKLSWCDSSLGCEFSQVDNMCTVNTNGASLTWDTTVNEIYRFSVGGREDGVVGNFELTLTES
jgi:hypothetical protein